jgi:hypothetical protein
MLDRPSREATLRVSVILHQEWRDLRLALLIPMRHHASLNWLLHLKASHDKAAEVHRNLTVAFVLRLMRWRPDRPWEES